MEINARLNLIPYDGFIEIKKEKAKKYIYIKKRILARNTSTYIDLYSDELFASISKLLKERKDVTIEHISIYIGTSKRTALRILKN